MFPMMYMYLFICSMMSFGRISSKMYTNLMDFNYQITNSKDASSNFDPYVDNGGSFVGAVGLGYCIFVCDTRLSEQYSIKSRNINRIHQLTENLLFCACGCHSDISELKKQLESIISRYNFDHHILMSPKEASQILSGLLYTRRTFPFFSFCCIGGIDALSGEASMYHFDAIGSREEVSRVCLGRSQKLIEPILDSKLFTKIKSLSISSTKEIKDQDVASKFPLNYTLNCIFNSFKSASEREIAIGDNLNIIVLKNNKGKLSYDSTNINIKTD